MDVIWFYVLACIPWFVGGAMWVMGRRVVWQEWVGGTAIGFVMAGIFHAIALVGQTDDIETWSGQIKRSREYSAWQEYYEYAVYRTETYTTSDGKGNISVHTRVVFDHWEPTSRWHGIHWGCESNIQTSYNISKDYHKYFERQFKDRHPEKGTRTTGEHNSRMLDGDPFDYVADNKTGWIEPVTKLVKFENKIKATPTTFSYQKVPPNAKVLPYPKNQDAFHSDRLVGTARATVDLLLFDQMNARLGPSKRVNVILVGMGSVNTMEAQYQEAAWVGGKKNDVVVCWGGDNNKPDWVRAFGWTENKECLRQLESTLLEIGISSESLDEIESIIKERYVIKDWSKFDYIKVPAPMWSIYWYISIALIAQAGFWYWARNNEFEKL